MTIERTERFLVVKAEEGMLFTSFNPEVDNILDYMSSTLMYCPLTSDLSGFYDITEEQDANYKELQEKAIKDEISDRERETVSDEY